MRRCQIKEANVKEANGHDPRQGKEAISQSNSLDEKKCVDKPGISLQKQVDEYKEILQRLQADFENYKKRVEKENCQIREYGIACFMQKLLPLLDSFELAFKGTCEGIATDAIVKGFELIYAQFYSILESEGLRPIKAVGERFDPYLHEVLMKDESDKDGIVLEELQKGYMCKDSVLRHSKVKVGEKPAKKSII